MSYGTLPDQLLNRIRIKPFSLRADQNHAQWVKRFILFQHKQHPKDMVGNN